MKKNTTKRVLNYGALSAAILGAADAVGQVVYTDIEPDEVISLGGSFTIDMNDDGIGDFNPQVFDAANGGGAVIFPTSMGSNGNQGSNGNGFVGITNGNYEYPSSMIPGTVIDGNANLIVDARGDMNFYSCNYTYSQFCGVTDALMGVVFVVGGDTHYGWIRMDVSTPGDEIVIKGWAFDATPDEPIEAGDEGTLGTATNQIDGLTHIVSNDVLTIRADVQMDQAVIFNINGQQMINTSINNNTAEINLGGMANGIYFAKVSANGIVSTIKFVK